VQFAAIAGAESGILHEVPEVRGSRRHDERGKSLGPNVSAPAVPGWHG
jgi:hypothetical protein